MSARTSPVNVKIGLHAKAERGRIGVDLIELRDILRAIDEVQSLTPSGKAVGLSYRTVWSRVRAYRDLFGSPLVEMSAGMGSRLTRAGRGVLNVLQSELDKNEALLHAQSVAIRVALDHALHGTDGPWHIKASHDFALAALFDGRNRAIPNTSCTYSGSLNSIKAMRRGEVDVAGFHLLETSAQTARTDADILELIRSSEHWCIPVMQREQGIMVQPGNPRAIHQLIDLAKPAVQFINRQRGSGTRLLLDELLAAGGIAPSTIEGYEQEEFTHLAVAAIVAAGGADAAMGLRNAASRFNLDFVSLGWETYYFAGPKESRDSAWVQNLVATTQKAANTLIGYRSVTPPSSP